MEFLILEPSMKNFIQCRKFKKHLNFKYPLNIVKILLLNHFTKQNKTTALEYGLKTNDYLLGVGYTGMMDSQTVECGLNALDGRAFYCRSTHSSMQIPI